MSLETDGVWKAGVWATTTWAANVWREGEKDIVTGGSPSVWTWHIWR